MTILSLVGAGLGVSVAPACVQRIASPDVVCLTLSGSHLISELELVTVVGDTRPVVEQSAKLATETQTH